MYVTKNARLEIWYKMLKSPLTLQGSTAINNKKEHRMLSIFRIVY